MVGKRKQPMDAEPLPGAQPTAGSGTTPGSAQGAEELSNTADKPPYTGPGAYAGGVQVAPGANDGMQATPEDAELGETEADSELAKESEEPMVVYVGDFTKREITKAEWERAGISDMPTVAWERRTGHRVPANVFTPQALQVLRQDGSFRVP